MEYLDQEFKEERVKRKAAGQPVGAPLGAPGGGMPPPGTTPGRGGDRDFRSSREDYRERDRGYERHSRYE